MCWPGPGLESSGRNTVVFMQSRIEIFQFMEGKEKKPAGHGVCPAGCCGFICIAEAVVAAGHRYGRQTEGLPVEACAVVYNTPRKDIEACAKEV